MPALLLLVARDLLLHDPPRVLAWRLLHEERLSDLPRWLAALAPRAGAFDRDPLALLLGAACSAVAVAYLLAGMCRARRAVRGSLLALGALAAVVIPTVALMAMGWAMQRPYGQDGGVVQLPLAIEHLLSGRSPYGADYSASILGRQARVSPFWQAYGGNPLLTHHAYLPGTHLLMLPGYLVARLAGVAFDPRLVTLVAWGAAALLAARLAPQRDRKSGEGGERALAAAAVVLVNPLVYWPQAFGANDVLQVALLLLAVKLAESERPIWSGAVLGLACASKQLAWPFAPFLLAHLSGARSLGDLLRAPAWRRVAGPALAALAVFAAVVLPVAALDPRRFWTDIVVYNVGLPAADSYPLGGTPGFGFANFLIYFGRVSSLRDHVSLAGFYLLLLPLGLLLLRRQLREPRAAAALVTGSAALLLSVFFSRVVHANYLMLAAILLPIGLLACARSPRPAESAPAPAAAGGGWAADIAIVPLLLLMVAVELVEHELLRPVWEDAVSIRLPQHLAGLASWLAPRSGPQLTVDPLGLFFAATAAGLAVLWLCAGTLGLDGRWRLALVGMALLVLVAAPARVVARVGEASGNARAQHEGFVIVAEQAGRAAGRSETASSVSEAWSLSFRRDPPARLMVSSPGTPPERALGRLLGWSGLTDPRPLAVLGLFVSALLIALAVPAVSRPLAVGAIALAPPAVVGAVFGSLDAVALALVLATLLLLRARPIAAGVALGIACALFPRLLWAAPLLLLLRERPRPRTILATITALAATWGAASAIAGPQTGLPRLVPGLGLPNVILYAGGESVAPWIWLTMASGVMVAAVWRAIQTPPGPARLAEAGLFLLAGLWLLPGTSPHDLVVPMTLIIAAALLSVGDENDATGSRSHRAD